MTIAISIQTSTAVVFAADSRLTTYGRVGFDTNGEPIVVPQTYENATKVMKDQSNTAMVVVTGSATLGRISFMETQVQMERFLPGEPFCGGPIDLMVVKTAPVQEILWHPGKLLHHPGGRRLADRG